MPPHLAHHRGNFRERERSWSDKVRDDGMTFADEPAPVEKGTFQGALESLVGAIITVASPRPKSPAGRRRPRQSEGRRGRWASGCLPGESQ